MTDNIAKTPLSFGNVTSELPTAMIGSSTLHYSAYNYPLSLGAVGAPGSAIQEQDVPAQYPHVKTNLTPSGHVIQYNDTPAGERVLIKHRTGAGVDMLPDGSIAIYAAGKHSLTVQKDATIVIAGSAKIQIDGNFDVDVTGDYNINCMNHNVNIRGNHYTAVKGSQRTVTTGNYGNTVKGSSSVTTLGTSTTTTLGNTNLITKGTTMMASEGDMQIAGGGATKVTSEAGIDISSDNMNIAANSMTVIGSTGTIGGAGVHLYGYNAHIQNTVYGTSMQAETFHGDLEGTARDAQEAGVAGGLGPVTIGSLTATAVDTTATALPDAALMKQYLEASEKGIVEVNIDPGGEIVKMIDRTEFNGGLSRDDLVTSEIRQKMRDPANYNNEIFTGNQVAAGQLSPSYANTAPPSIGRTSPNQPNTWRSPNTVGAVDPGWIRPGPKPARKSFLPDIDHYINGEKKIVESTELLSGVPISRFLGKGTTLNHIVDPTQRRQIARNLQLHAWYLTIINSGQLFDSSLYTLKVQTGLYKAGPRETPTPESVNDLATRGQAVAYQLVNNSSGKVEIAKTYDLAIYLKDFIPFDKLIIDYDTYQPDGKMDVAIIIQTPAIPPNYTGIRYQNLIETRFNGSVQSSTDLMDLYQPPGNQIDTSGFLTGTGSLPSDGVVVASNPNPNALPKQNIIDAIATAVRELSAARGASFVAVITPEGGKAARDSGTKNHPAGDAADHYLVQNGTQLLPNQAPRVYSQYLNILKNNARARGITIGLGGYPWGVHYDESGWRQQGQYAVVTWNQGFDVTA